jgi:hypothetical protein
MLAAGRPLSLAPALVHVVDRLRRADAHSGVRQARQMTTASPSAAAMRSIERIKACLNGGRRRDEHPAVPVTPAELAAAAAAAVRAGAEAVHLRARSGNGAESLRALDIAAAGGAVRRACPDVPVGLSTGLRMVDGDVRARRDLVRGWGTCPPCIGRTRAGRGRRTGRPVGGAGNASQRARVRTCPGGPETPGTLGEMNRQAATVRVRPGLAEAQACTVWNQVCQAPRTRMRNPRG